MSKEHPIEIFMPPNMLKAKVGGRISGIDVAAVRRAELAMAGLKSKFQDWINAEVTALADAFDTYRESRSDADLGALYRAGHDLRGQAGSFDFPLISQVAKSLCKLLDALGGKAPLPLIEAHVNTIRVIIRQKVKGTDDKTASALAHELDARVSEFLDKIGG